MACMEQIKNSIAHYHDRKKSFIFSKIVLLHGTQKLVLLWCMGLGKNVNRLDPDSKKDSVYNTTMVHRTKKKLNWQSISTDKKYIFVTGYSITMMHGT